MQRTIFLFVLGCLCLSLHAEEIQLKDGTKITGKLTGINGDVFQVKTAYGDIKVPRGDVLTINFPENRTAAGETTETDAPSIDESLLGTTYTNRTAKFQITAPSGWVMAPEMRKSKDVVAALKSPDEVLFFMVTPERFTGSLATYLVLAETQYRTKFKDYEKLSESEAQLDGRKGIRLIWRGKSPQAGDAPMKVVVYLLPYEGRMVRLSFLTLEPLFNEAFPTFEKMAASYHSIDTHGDPPK